MEPLRFEPTPPGELLDRAFVLYRRNFVRFLAIVAVVHIPFGLVSVAVMVLLAEEGLAQPGESPFGGSFAPFGFCCGFGLMGLLKLMADGLAVAALVRSVAQTYLGRDVTVGQAYRFILPKTGWILLAAVLTGIAKGIGLYMLVLPALFLHILFALTVPAIVIENAHTFRAIGRSAVLTMGNFGRALFVLGAAALIYYILYAFFYGCSTLALMLIENPDLLALSMGLQQVILMLGPLLGTPILGCAAILFYYDARMRREGYDLEMVAARIEAAGRPTA